MADDVLDKVNEDFRLRFKSNGTAILYCIFKGRATTWSKRTDGNSQPAYICAECMPERQHGVDAGLFDGGEL